MSVTELHNVFAVFAIVALAGTVVLVVARLVPSVATVRLLAAVKRVQLPLAALVATTATLGSLYFSEFGDKWVPCRFCWYQRVFMYSSAVVLIVALIRRDRGGRWYAATLSGIGIIISTWHILLEHGVVAESKECALTVPCATPYRVSFSGRNEALQPAHWYGITLAVMAFCGFAAILALTLLPQALDDVEQPAPDAPA